MSRRYAVLTSSLLACGAHAEHAIRLLQRLAPSLRCAARRSRAAHERLELRELGAAHAERARDAPQQLALLRADLARADRGLQLNLHERARQVAAAADLLARARASRSSSG